LQTLIKDIAIIGTGFGGLGMAIKLKQAGHDDFVILEKGASSGGCWRENSYPGAACDVPSLLYSFSFEPKTDWSRAFAPQPEIEAYLKHCENKYGLSENIQFNTEVTDAVFDESTGRWLLTTANGQQISARIFISACGQLSQPAIPHLKGIENFTGKVMHSARWDHNYSLKGKKVAVIGSGASAIQFVPEVAKEVETLHVLQRSAPYILPKPDRAYSEKEKIRFKSYPLWQKLCRLGLYLSHESRLLGFTSFQVAMGAVRAKCAKHMKKTITDPLLRQKFTPDYPIGCKRVLISNSYYQAFNQDNVSLETESIEAITDRGIKLKDGREIEVDTLIYGTGFKATEFLTPMEVTGLQGKTLNQEWHKGAEAYLGITVKDFPNFFMLYGPNTNLGHSSIVYMLESQIQYILDAVEILKKDNLKYLNVLEQSQNQFNQGVQDKLKNTVWEKGCVSWYKNDDGKNTVNWPDFTFKYRHQTRQLNLNHYQLTPVVSK
jgi:cation diffusion facilitator CzcD-associated flavoprotein CzcO